MLATKNSTDEQVRALFQEALGQSVVAATPITDRGLANSVFNIETSAGHFILRVNEPSGLGTYLKERWCADTARAAGIRTPKVLHVGKNDAFAFHISEYVAGQDALDLDQAARLRAWTEIGAMLRTLHTIPAQGFGEDLAGPVHGDLLTTVRDWAEWFSEYCCGTGDLLYRQVLTLEQQRSLLATFERIACLNALPVVCHGNAVPKNFRVDAQGQTWLLDWGTAAGHLPQLDLAELHAFVGAAGERAAFYEGYGRTYAGREPELRDLTIARLAISAVWLSRRKEPVTADFQESAARLRELIG